MDDRPYYYRLRGRTMGPIGLRQIRQLAQRAQIGRMTDVSRDGLQWAKAGDFPEVFQASGAEPPGADGNSGGDRIGGGKGDFQLPSVKTALWYYTQQGAQQGPVDLGTLQQLVATGQVAASEHAIPEGGTDWQLVSSLPQLAGAGAPVINVNVPQGRSEQAEGSNGMAIAGFVLSLIGCAPLGLILSLVALNSKNKANRGLAIAGAVIGGLLTLCGCGYVVIAIIAAAANA